MEAQTKPCQNCSQGFVIEPEDFDFYKKMEVPPPTFCSQCRFQRRAAYRNERSLVRNKSAKSGKEILSLCGPDSGRVVYEESEWWSDDWSPMDYGRDYDFSKPFFEQFRELASVVPRPNRSIINLVDSDYCANASYLKNCYLLFNSNRSEDSAYGNGVDSSKNSFDNSHIRNCERSYGSFWLTNCYQTHFSSQCEDCTSVWFSKNLRGCSNCFGCVNLRDKKYHIFNQSYSKEEYEVKLKEVKLDTKSGLREAKVEAKRFWLLFPNKFMQGIKNTDVTGEYVTHSKNVKNAYLVREGEDLKYVQYLQVPANKNCYDMTVWGDGNERGYENSVCGHGAYNLRFCNNCWTDVRDLEYSQYCLSSSDCYGCVGLRKKKFCILNKEYSEAEYKK